jgi:hypothetical protein
MENVVIYDFRLTIDYFFCFPVLISVNLCQEKTI